MEGKCQEESFEKVIVDSGQWTVDSEKVLWEGRKNRRAGRAVLRGWVRMNLRWDQNSSRGALPSSSDLVMERIWAT